jgi:hypothetical protein
MKKDISEEDGGWEYRISGDREKRRRGDAVIRR